MSKKAFKIEGDFQMGRVRQHFNVELIGDDETDAREHLYKDLGSRHGVKKRQIDIQNVTELDAESANDITRKRLALS